MRETVALLADVEDYCFVTFDASLDDLRHEGRRELLYRPHAFVLKYGLSMDCQFRFLSNLVVFHNGHQTSEIELSVKPHTTFLQINR